MNSGCTRPSILLVDDEAAVLRTTAAILSDDYEVMTAPDAESALATLEQRPCDVLCTDFMMPGRSGLELIRIAAERWPDTALILTTGYREYSDRGTKMKRNVYFLLLKPYQPRQLLELVDRAVTAARLSRRTREISASLTRGASDG